MKTIVSLLAMWMALSVGSLQADVSRAARFESLHGLAAAPAAPSALGEPLDLGFTQLGEDVKPRSKAEWLRRLEVRKGRATLAPLRALDPSEELLVIIPGNGMNFQDLHALVQLDDAFQVMIAVYDPRRPVTEAGARLADALEEVLAYREALGRARGVTPGRKLRLIGHSFGCPAGHLMLGELAERGRLGTTIPQVLFVAMDGPWRGIDLPWLATLPGIKHVASWLMTRLKVHRAATPGNLSFVNRTRAMKSVGSLQMPECVTTQFVTVLGKMDTSARWRHLEPVANWFSAELGKGEMELVWKFYDDGARNLENLKSWSTPLITKRVGLVNLVLALARDADYARHLPQLIEAARNSQSVEEFARRHDEILRRVVDAFQGQHTGFMWTDARFMPWVRGVLAK